MIILAMDTTSDQASVALRRDGATVWEEVIATTDGHSYLLYQMIENVLQRSEVALSQVDCFASAIGPGSFTGVRICLAAVKGLADATGKPASGVSNLRALATFGKASLRNPIIDARRGQIYTAVYDAELQLVSPEIVIPVEQWHVAAGVEEIKTVYPMAAAIAFCAELDGSGKWSDPAALDANYVRRADGDNFWQDLSARI